ncbi:hypothetical protein ACRE_089580 [Hapsidospora chrysogenum ATCC 11550]|uniref:Uncharacterized protein n=1 Tax=Hapsidospora chrysogenum (strain ATCC 11550 / CBS 779.69 / DSM 880 / IAM 14645 / JCM 23072 / IMI 49137) TaxID=857340 RepID=A0A086STE8_HAPC1|nr:hypothetical protein ACRE_089580 [Hapsidospora chrysogenum ATCC 11550]
MASSSPNDRSSPSRRLPPNEDPVGDAYVYQARLAKLAEMKEAGQSRLDGNVVRQWFSQPVEHSVSDVATWPLTSFRASVGSTPVLERELIR